MIDPAKPFSSRPAPGRADGVTRAQVAHAKADLSGLLDRARDERFRLLKMLRDARAEVADSARKTPAAPVEVSVPPAAAPAEPAAAADNPAPHAPQLKQLVDKLTALDAQLDAKLVRLNRVTDEKLERIEKIDQRMTPIVQQLGHALADGRIIQKDLEGAAATAKAVPARITEQLERFDDHLAAYQHAGADAFAEEMARMKQAALDEMRAEVGQRRRAFDAELADAQALLERELTHKFDALADQLHDRADGLLSRTENTANEALKRVRGEVVQAMARSHDTQEAFRQKLDEHRARHQDYLASLADSADGEFQVHAQRLDETMAGLTELFDSQADEILNQLRDRATTLLDRMAATVLKLQDTAMNAEQAESAAADDGEEGNADRRAA